MDPSGKPPVLENDAMDVRGVSQKPPLAAAAVPSVAAVAGRKVSLFRIPNSSGNR